MWIFSHIVSLRHWKDSPFLKDSLCIVGYCPSRIVGLLWGYTQLTLKILMASKFKRCRTLKQAFGDIQWHFKVRHLRILSWLWQTTLAVYGQSLLSRLLSMQTHANWLHLQLHIDVKVAIDPLIELCKENKHILPKGWNISWMFSFPGCVCL